MIKHEVKGMRYMDRAEERIKEIRSQLEHHADLYYNKDEPEITDYEYDMLMQELKELRKSILNMLRQRASHAESAAPQTFADNLSVQIYAELRTFFRKKMFSDS